MRKIGRRGIATIAAVVAIVAVAGVATGTPIAVDQIDTNPNNPLYSLERMGEQIKEATYAGGVSWNLQRAKERTKEYRAVARTEIPNDHLSLLEDAGNRLSKAVKKVDSGKELGKVRETLKFHKQVLREVRNETPDVANPAISFAISNADRMKAVLDKVEPSKVEKEKGIPKQVTEELKGVRQKTQEMGNLVRQAKKGKISNERATRRIELKTAQPLMNELAKAVEKENLKKHTGLVDAVQKHLSMAAKAAGENQKLRKAIEAVKKHTEVLENVKEKVPKPAKKAIQRAIEQSKTGLRKLREIAQGKGFLKNIPRKGPEKGPKENISPRENVPGKGPKKKGPRKGPQENVRKGPRKKGPKKGPKENIAPRENVPGKGPKNKGPKKGPRENVRKENRERIKTLKKQARKAITKFQEKMEKLENKREKIENWYENRKEKLTKKFEESRENWRENIEKRGKRLEEKFDQIERAWEKRLENLKSWRERISRKFKKRAENILEHIKERKKFGKLENFAPELENFAPELENFASGVPENFWAPFENLYWIQENKWKGQWSPEKEGKGKKGAGPPEKVLDKVENILEKKHERLEQMLENRFEHAKKRMERRKEMLENRADKLENRFVEKFDKLSEKLDRKLRKLMKKREKRLGKIEKKMQKAKERLRKRLKKVARKLEWILPKNASAEDILEDMLENRELPKITLKPAPKGNSMPFIHGGGKPPWAGPPEFVPENEKKWDNINFEVPENQKKAENKTTAYKLMGPELPDHSVSYSVNPANEEGINRSTAMTEIKAAFETWDDHTSKELFSDEVSTTTKSGFEHDGTNTVSFAPLDTNTAAAMTRVWYSDNTITEFDVVFNTKREFGVDPDGEGPRTIDEFDLQAVATHEVGHALGLMDLEDSDYSELTMYYSTDPGSTIKISLESGDIAGLHELYGS